MLVQSRPDAFKAIIYGQIPNEYAGLYAMGFNDGGKRSLLCVYASKTQDKIPGTCCIAPVSLSGHGKATIHTDLSNYSASA